MKYEQCFACDHCDTSITNGLNQVRCKKFSTYVDMYNGCDYYKDKKMTDLFSEILKNK
jgi:hypothetical protein